jgi:hypothetical protein
MKTFKVISKVVKVLVPVVFFLLACFAKEAGVQAACGVMTLAVIAEYVITYYKLGEPRV